MKENPEPRRALARELLDAARAFSPGIERSHAVFLWEQARLREGLMAALHPDGQAATRFAEKLCDTIPGISAEHAKIAARQMFARRTRDQQRFFDLLTRDAEFTSGKILLTPQESNSPAHKLVSMLAQQESENGPEPVIHILAQAEAQERWHAALAECWKPGAEVHAALLAAMKEALPDVRSEAVEHAAAYFMQQRHRKALEVTEAMRPQSPVLAEAIDISLRGKTLAEKPSPLLSFRAYVEGRSTEIQALRS